MTFDQSNGILVTSKLQNATANQKPQTANQKLLFHLIPPPTTRIMKQIFTLFAILTSNLLFAQVDNSLNFDGVDDKVEVANASALISNTSTFSLSFWVNPQNLSPSYPDFDGFCGFRNETDCDFYVIQVSPTEVEARFRNSLNTVYTITSPTLQLNTWQHYALTYDGSKMRLYHNGILTDSLSASGTISNTSVPFYIGNILYSITDFFLNGSMDEVSMWNTTLSAPDINCIYKSYVDSTSAGLVLYYNFNEGAAFATNTGIDTLNPSVGNLPGIMSTFNLSGFTSNWATGIQNYNSITDVFCPNTTYTFGSQTLSEPGTYLEYYTDANGCDSIARLILYSTINDSVSVYTDSIMAFQSNAVYQWLDCDNANSPIAGATSRGFSPQVSGNYAVTIDYNNCTDTSDCVNYIMAGINSVSINRLNITTNPVIDNIFFNQSLQHANVILTNVEGKKVVELNDVSSNAIDAAMISAGTYVVTVKENERVSTFRIVKR
jgi:hypothetical protein